MACEKGVFTTITWSIWDALLENASKLPAFAQPKLKKYLPQVLESRKRIAASQELKIVYGTDSGAGGYEIANNWKEFPTIVKYGLTPVRALKAATTTAALATSQGFAHLRDHLYATAWVGYANAPLAGPAQVVDYMGRYPHRVAITHTRLVEVRDLIGGQGWFDVFQYRMDPPDGTSMHWSRLIDAPLAGLILLLKPLLGMHDAQALTLYFWPALLFAIALALIAAIARQVSNSTAPVIAAVVLGVLAFPALVHFRAGAIDHHNAQIV